VPPAQRAFARDAGEDAAREAFHLAALQAAIMLALAGVGGLALRNPRREDVQCADCPGGQLVGAPQALAPARAAVAAK
jgi:hypothetical protein